MSRIVLLVLLLPTTCLKGQELDLERFAERLFQLQEADIPYEDLYESLLMYYSHPINLNKASREQLSELYLLNTAQIQSFLAHRTNFGPLLSIYELQTIKGFDLNTIEELRPFVKVQESGRDNRSLLSKILEGKNSYLFTRYARRLPAPDVYDTDKFAGSPDHIYTRFRSRVNDDYSLGFTLEKDPGEALWSDSIKGFDFSSFHFQLENRGLVKNLVFGDFQYQVGQGIVLGSGFNPGKGAETIQSTMRNTVGARPYTSALESGFFRGVSVSIEHKKIESSLFASFNNRNGRVKEDSTASDFRYFTSLNSIGLHRSASEIATRHSIDETSLGGYFRYHFSRTTTVGITGIYSGFSSPLIPATRDYNYFEFRGSENYLGSVFFRHYLQNLTFFSEISRSKSGGMGSIAGMTAILNPKIETSLLYRNYSRDFHSFYGNSFGETSRNINEKGLYWGWKIKFTRQHSLNLYLDYFKFPWLRFRVHSPSSGHEWMGRYTYAPNRNHHYFVQFRREVKERTEPGTASPEILTTARNSFIVNADYEVTDKISAKTRIQGSVLSERSTTSGLALLQDINFDFNKLRLSLRYSIFETDNFDNRQYIYERDVLYAFSIPAYFGRGLRYYALITYKISRKVSIWAKVSQSSYPFDNTIGSGDKMITGNQQTDLRLQLRKVF